MTEPLKTDSKLKTVAWNNPNRHDLIPHEYRLCWLTWPDMKARAEDCSQALCDQAAAESLLAQRDAQIAELKQALADEEANSLAFDAERAERLKAQSEAAALAKRLEAAEAVAAADGTLHGAVEHWQAKAAERQAKVEAMRDKFSEVDGLLTSLQPHIPQACYPGHAVFIDDYIDPALGLIRSAMQQQKGGSNAEG